MIRRRPRAIYAIIEQAEFIGSRSLASAERFLDATEETFEQIERAPGIGHRYESDDEGLGEIRIWSVKGFPNHLIFYRPFPLGIEILHLLHGARDIGAALAEELQKGEL
jgi:toxin ParE1/3/4